MWPREGHNAAAEATAARLRGPAAPSRGRELEASEVEGGRHDAADQAPRSKRASRLPGARRDDRLDTLAAGDIGPEPMRRHGQIAVGPDPQFERVAAGVLPDLVGIDAMPVRSLAGLEQVEDRAADRSLAGRRLGPPRLDIPAALRMRLHAEGFDDGAGLEDAEPASLRDA